MKNLFLYCEFNKNIIFLYASIKCLIILLYFYYLNYIHKIQLLNIYKENNLKVCICTLGKEENRYIKEFVEHYKNYGVDKIYLYDNNDIEAERFEEVINEYVKTKFVEIIDWRGVKGTATYYGIMDSCYQANYDKYDWLIFYEIDEFLYLKEYNNIKTYLANKKFDKCESIQLNWVHMSDNNYLFYEDKPLHIRFTEIGKNVNKKKYNRICFVKTIIKGHLKNINITHNHLLNKNLTACDGFGKKSKVNKIESLNPDYEHNFIRHYYSKTVQEFIDKINRGDLLRGNNKKIIEWSIEKFFLINKITIEKIKYIQKYLGKEYNLTKYINELNEQKEVI